LRGESDAAIAHLKRAFNNRPYTDKRPILTEYQWAEACEWLFEATKDTRYRDLALDWARVNQKIQPMFSWPYALEYKLSAPGEQRNRALAMTLYLDPGSERIKSASDAERSKAKAWFAAHNPFKVGKASKPPSRVTRAAPELLLAAR